MIKKALIAVSAIAILLMVTVSYLTARFVDHKEILRAKDEAEQLKKSRDSILSAVGARDTIQQALKAQGDSFRTVAFGLQRRVDSLEIERAAAQLGVRELRTGEAQEEKFRKTFPAFSRRMRVTDWFDADSRESVRYLMVPLAAAESFIIDRQDAISFRQQRDTLLTIDSLHRQVIGLQDSIVHLEHANRLAFQQGYDSAFARYEDISHKYITLLEKPPQVKFGLPSWGTILVSAAAGVVVGTQIK